MSNCLAGVDWDHVASLIDAEVRYRGDGFYAAGRVTIDEDGIWIWVDIDGEVADDGAWVYDFGTDVTNVLPDGWAVIGWSRDGFGCRVGLAAFRETILAALE